VSSVVAGATVEMINGNAAIARGALDAGIDTFFGYPITPATSIMERLANEMPKRGGRLLQTEDEISAISAVVGAGFTGARAATSTSGPGLSLMAEMLGMGVIGEVPGVVFVSQRGGPSTGMPTKTEQSDLHMAVYGGHGDAPRIVIAPTNVDGCYRCAGKAFEMAEAYQTPVIVLIDLYLSNRYETVVFPARPPFEADLNRKPGKQAAGAQYKRYALTEDHVSPRAVPGDKGGMHVVTGLEHNELGRPNDSAELHTAMSRKRHEKLKRALKHPDFTQFKRFGDEGPVDVGVISWGSNFGECLEAMLKARAEGIRCAAMKVVMLSPFPTRGGGGFHGRLQGGAGARAQLPGPVRQSAAGARGQAGDPAQPRLRRADEGRGDPRGNPPAGGKQGCAEGGLRRLEWATSNLYISKKS
jgi:2-oxoglutarate ferredoxin oxidoreductase subunit alpha